jgi:hypothetical protein
VNYAQNFTKFKGCAEIILNVPKILKILNLEIDQNILKMFQKILKMCPNNFENMANNFENMPRS